MVKISEYKGYEINYDSDKLFWIDMKDINRYQLKSEKDAQKYIDDELKEKEEIEKKEQEEEKLKEIPEFKVCLAEPSYLKDSMTIVKTLVNEARLVFKKDKISIVAMDPANVMMVLWELLSSCCIEYKVPKDFAFALNISNFSQVLNKSKPTDIIVLEYLDKENIKVSLKGKYKRSYTLPIIDFEEGDYKIPDLKFNAEVTMPSKLFEQQINESSAVAESVNFIAKDKFMVESKGDLSRYDSETLVDSDIIIKVENESKSKYSIEYLNRAIKTKKLVDTVKVRFSNDYPLRLDYNLLDKLSLSFILAPRVEND